MDRIEKALQPSGEPRASFDDLKAASTKAAEIIARQSYRHRSSCGRARRNSWQRPGLRAKGLTPIPDKLSVSGSVTGVQERRRSQICFRAELLRRALVLSSTLGRNAREARVSAAIEKTEACRARNGAPFPCNHFASRGSIFIPNTWAKRQLQTSVRKHCPQMPAETCTNCPSLFTACF